MRQLGKRVPDLSSLDRKLKERPVVVVEGAFERVGRLVPGTVVEGDVPCPR